MFLLIFLVNILIEIVSIFILFLYLKMWSPEIPGILLLLYICIRLHRILCCAACLTNSVFNIFFLLLIKIILGYNYQFSHRALCILYQLYFNPPFLSSHLFMLLSLKILSYVEKEKWFLFPLTIYRISIINIKIFFLWLFHITPPFKRFVWKLIL